VWAQQLTVNAAFTLLLASCRLCDVEPWAYLRDVFCLLPRWPDHRLLDLAPVEWVKIRQLDDVQTLLDANPFRRLTLGRGWRADMAKRYACPCCGYLTLHSPPPGSYELCPVCDCEDDGVQFRDPDYEGGANTESLNTARTNFRNLGASSPGAVSRVRAPRPEEKPEHD